MYQLFHLLFRLADEVIHSQPTGHCNQWYKLIKRAQ